VNIHTVQFSHILETSELENLHYFLSHSVFVISHKNVKVKTLCEVLWYLPLNSPIIIVTNCQESEREDLTKELKIQLAHHPSLHFRRPLASATGRRKWLSAGRKHAGV
jgi:mannosyl-3-phosphoglycerate synthase